MDMCCTSNMGRLSSHATFPKVPELLASCSLSRGLRSVNQWHRDHSAILSRNLGDAICCYFGVDSCTDRVIAGFWVGPDVDDGWGYVEAFINQTL
ncbi:uncharacterized protein LOC115694002 isoform X2 [Syzygium oleosum]|uniref:uncharacterized protein LOC115694002 isoform X2 n=1 Tax=Syzygium oleosum TaxID=219896 RepID=UPI0024BBBE9D|nr:uncharacterized protein LOC115694002 isoform X2 [Syzygium oleosum]